ncbi:FlgO family outer membrane protein [Thalassotalea piscium]
MKTIKYILTTVLLISIAGCSLNQISSFDLGESDKKPDQICVNNKGESTPCDEIKMANKANENKPLFQPGTNFQTLGEYTEQMVYVIFSKLSIEQVDKTIAVPPFISSIANTQTDSKFNIELAELFIADMQNIGLPVAENILTYAEPDETSDFVNTIADMQNNEDIGYILKGTIRENDKGVMIYAKIINIESKKIIGSTSKLIPHYLLAKLAS